MMKRKCEDDNKYYNLFQGKLLFQYSLLLLNKEPRTGENTCSQKKSEQLKK